MVADLFEGILDLGTAVSYQAGGIVSKTIINKKAGTVTLFAFDTDQSLSEHTAPFDALIVVVEGSVEVTVGGSVYHANAGNVVGLPANVPHGVRAPERFKMLLVMIKT